MEQDAAAGGDLQAGSHHQAQYESGGDGAEHDSRGSRGSTPRTMKVRISEDFRVRIVADELQLLYIYDKADFENVSDAFLRDIMKRMES